MTHLIIDADDCGTLEEVEYRIKHALETCVVHITLPTLQHILDLPAMLKDKHEADLERMEQELKMARQARDDADRDLIFERRIRANGDGHLLLSDQLAPLKVIPCEAVPDGTILIVQDGHVAGAITNIGESAAPAIEEPGQAAIMPIPAEEMLRLERGIEEGTAVAEQSEEAQRTQEAVDQALEIERLAGEHAATATNVDQVLREREKTAEEELTARLQRYIVMAPNLYLPLDPHMLVQLALDAFDNPLKVGATYAQKAFGMASHQQAMQPLKWARYHARQMRQLRADHRNEYSRLLLKDRQETLARCKAGAK
jgi:hypothetical protein